MITEKKPKLKKQKEINIVDKNKEQLYFHFDDLENEKQLKKIKNKKLTNGKSKIIVRWFDYYNSKDYKTDIYLKTALKRSLKLIKKIIKEKKLNVKSLNASGLASVIVSNNKIFIEPQFS